jgi:transcription factor Dp-1
VYDALNVLMAMNIITKEKKEIMWKGLPTTTESDVEHLRAEKLRAQAQIENKNIYLQELVEQYKVGLYTLNAVDP